MRRAPRSSPFKSLYVPCKSGSVHEKPRGSERLGHLSKVAQLVSGRAKSSSEDWAPVVLAEPPLGHRVPASSLQATWSCVLCAWTLPSGHPSRKSCVTRPASRGAGRRSARWRCAQHCEWGRRLCRGQQPGSPVKLGVLPWGGASYGALAFPPRRWETRALAPCPVTCGGGQVPLAVRCVRLDGGRSISLPHSKCWPVPRPGPLEDCSPEPCPARWALPREAGGPGGSPGLHVKLMADPGCRGAHGGWLIPSSPASLFLIAF